MARRWFRQTWWLPFGRDLRLQRSTLTFRPSQTLVWTVVDPEPAVALRQWRGPAHWSNLRGASAEPPPTGAVALLHKVCPPPTNGPRPAVDWATVEATLGTPLPSDYRALVDERGSGVVGDVIVYAPGSHSQRLDLVTWLKSLSEMVAALRAATCAHFPPAFFPEEGGILPWAEVDGGRVVAWATDHPDPNRWPVVVLSHTWEQLTLHPVTAAGYLLARLPGPDLEQLAPSG